MSRQGIPNIDAEAFVRAWQTSSSLEEVSTRLSIGEKRAAQRAVLLRRKGVPLQRFTGSKKGLDIEALARLAGELAQD